MENLERPSFIKKTAVVTTGAVMGSKATVQAIRCPDEGGLGDIYMDNGLCLKPRGSMGPASYRSFNANCFHDKWHWLWDTGNGDFGNQGSHMADIARWVLFKVYQSPFLLPDLN